MSVTKKKTPAKKTSSKPVTLEDLFSKLENIEILSKMPDKMKCACPQTFQEAKDHEGMTVDTTKLSSNIRQTKEEHDKCTGGRPTIDKDGHPDAYPSQNPMQVDLIEHGHTGEIIGVIIDVAGSQIKVGRDGVVERQPTISAYSDEKFYRLDEKSEYGHEINYSIGERVAIRKGRDFQIFDGILAIDKDGHLIVISYQDWDKNNPYKILKFGKGHFEEWRPVLDSEDQGGYQNG